MNAIARVAACTVVIILIGVPVAHGACKRNDHGVFEDEGCAANAYVRADTELNATYQRLLSQLDAEAQEKLRRAQRAWIAFRDADAAFVYSMEGDGSAGRMVAANNGERLTQQRISALRDWRPSK